MSKKIILFFLLLLFSNTIPAEPIINHKITARVLPSEHFIEAYDIITVPSAYAKPVLHFLLNANLEVKCETPDVVLKLEERNVKAEDVGMDREDYSLISEISQHKYSLTFSNYSESDVTVKLKFS